MYNKKRPLNCFCLAEVGWKWDGAWGWGWRPGREGRARVACGLEMLPLCDVRLGLVSLPGAPRLPCGQTGDCAGSLRQPRAGGAAAGRRAVTGTPGFCCTCRPNSGCVFRCASKQEPRISLSSDDCQLLLLPPACPLPRPVTLPPLSR